MILLPAGVLAGVNTLPGPLLLGALVGLTYGLLAVGLVLVYRSNRLINFAHGETGLFAATIFALFVTRFGVPYWVCFPLALGLGAGIGMLSEVVVVRRLRSAPKLMTVVATLGLGQFLLLAALVANGQGKSGSNFPTPPFLPTFDLFSVRVGSAYVAMAVLGPAAIAGLVLFLQRSRYGTAIRAAAANPDAARLSGLSASRMSSLSWGIAGALSTFTGIVVIPTLGANVGAASGPSLLLRAMAAAVVARMESIPVAFATGIALGVLEAEVTATRIGSWTNGLTEPVLLVVILLAILVRPPVSGRAVEGSAWAALSPFPPLGRALRRSWAVRNLGWVVAGTAVSVGLLLPFVADNATMSVFDEVAGLGLVGLSVGIITGLSGQLSLGQLAIGGIGLWASWKVSVLTGDMLLGAAAAALVGAAVAVLIGIPALRVRGLLLAVVTLGFALSVQAWLLRQSWMLGEGITPGRPIIDGSPLDTDRTWWWAVLVVVVVGVTAARNVWVSGLGRRLRALRDNEDQARAFSVRATAGKLQAFALAGALAGLGGAVYGHTATTATPSMFTAADSIDVVAMAVLGGIGVLGGPLIGALYIAGLPRLVDLDSAGLAASALGWLLLLLYVPSGIAGVMAPARQRLVRTLARGQARPRGSRDGEGDGDADGSHGPATAPAGVSLPEVGRRDPLPAGLPLLQVAAVTKRFGGLTAVDAASFDVEEGEVVGLLGPNGAGKTTLFEILAGFTRADAGAVVYAGRDITALGPEARCRQGIVRSFQDAPLFPTMSVEDTLLLACERRSPTTLSEGLFGSPTRERRRRREVDGMLRQFGLDGYRDTPVGSLSTGTRRICELACLVILRPRLLLLDEPTAGIAQKETEALGRVLGEVRTSLRCTIVVIEHDIAFLRGLCDRIVAMETGEVIAVGAPSAVLANARVVAGYLGADPTTIARSGTLVGR